MIFWIALKVYLILYLLLIIAGIISSNTIKTLLSITGLYFSISLIPFRSLEYLMKALRSFKCLRRNYWQVFVRHWYFDSCGFLAYKNILSVLFWGLLDWVMHLFFLIQSHLLLVPCIDSQEFVLVYFLWIASLYIFSTKFIEVNHYIHISFLDVSSVFLCKTSQGLFALSATLLNLLVNTWCTLLLNLC